MDLEKALKNAQQVENAFAQVLRFIVVCLFPVYWCYTIAVFLRCLEYYLTGN